MGAMATIAKKRKWAAVEEAKELATQEAEAITMQYKLDDQFTRDMEESICRRGLEGPSILLLTSALRPKRVVKAPARFNGTIGKANRKKDKGKGRQI